MSRITQELRELTEIANILSKGNGSVTIRTTREPDYSHREIYKQIEEAIAAKVAALHEIKPEEYRAVVLSGAEALDIIGRPMTAEEMAKTIKRVQADLIGKKMFDEMETEKITPPEKEPLDSIEQHTVEFETEISPEDLARIKAAQAGKPESKADPRD